MKARLAAVAAAMTVALLATSAMAADFVVDADKAHASINFRIKHLGFSWLTGRFDKFSGNFTYDDKNPDASKVKIEIDTTSVDTNFAERDKHLRGADLLDVDMFPTATFESTSVKSSGSGQGDHHWPAHASRRDQGSHDRCGADRRRRRSMGRLSRGLHRNDENRARRFRHRAQSRSGLERSRADVEHRGRAEVAHHLKTAAPPVSPAPAAVISTTSPGLYLPLFGRHRQGERDRRRRAVAELRRSSSRCAPAQSPAGGQPCSSSARWPDAG